MAFGMHQLRLLLGLFLRQLDPLLCLSGGRVAFPQSLVGLLLGGRVLDNVLHNEKATDRHES